MSAIAGASNDPRPNAPSGGVPATTTHALALPGTGGRLSERVRTPSTSSARPRDATSTAAAM